MKKIGLICEYNPFHNGHLYHINKIKEMYPDSMLILVMSSCFSQRGNLSILTKEEKTDIALSNNIDLVVELPFIYSSQSADIFAKGAVGILNKLSVDYLVFGSESNNMDTLNTLADIQLNNEFYDELVKAYLSDGYNYPTAMSKALFDVSDIKIDSPNDLLGLSYVKEIKRLGSNIKPITIERTNDFHGTDINSNIVSATAIRESIKNNINIKDLVPSSCYKYLKDKEIVNYFNYFKYKVLSEGIDINKYQTVDEGIENRIITYINKCNDIDMFIHDIKTKRYTYNKISRMIIHIITSFTKEEASDTELKYIRILGFNNIGKDYLNSIKKDIDIPIITNIKKKDEELLFLDIRVEKIYNLLTNGDINSYKNKPIIKDK